MSEADVPITFPQPPSGLVTPYTAELVFTLLGAIPLAAVLVAAVRNLVRGRGPLLLFCLIGGGLAALYEPFVDVLGLVYLQNGSLGTFTLLGRTMPLFVPIIYPWYVGGLAYLTYCKLSQGLSRRALFGLWAVFALVNFALEAPGLLTGVYTYYGKQPWNLWGHPLWWGCVNGLTALLAGALVYALRPHLTTNLRLAAVIPVVYMADGISNAGTSWPMYAVLNDSHLPMAWSYAASLITVGLVLLVVWTISLFAVPRDDDAAEPRRDDSAVAASTRASRDPAAQTERSGQGR